MSIEDLLARYDDLRRLRDQIQATLSRRSEALRDASLAAFFSWATEHEDASIEEALSTFEDDWHLSSREKTRLAAELATGQAQTAAMISEMYIESGAITVPLKYETIQALHTVDFRRIDGDVRNMVIGKFQRMIASNGSFSTLVEELRAGGLVKHQARTLANTALATFDNAYTVQIAKEAGIERFVYHGPDPQRDFCRRHIGQTYTIAEIRRMNNGHGLDVLTSAGGYNCRHMWVAVPDNMIISARGPSQVGGGKKKDALSSDDSRDLSKTVSWLKSNFSQNVILKPSPRLEGLWGTQLPKAEALKKARTVATEFARLKSEHPNLKHSVVDLYITDDARGKAVNGTSAMRKALAVANDLSEETKDAYIRYEKTYSIFKSTIRPDTFVADNFRHELGHNLTTTAVLNKWQSMHRFTKNAWLEKHVSEYATYSDFEALAEMFTMYTAPGYTSGTLPSKIETLIQFMLGEGE